MIRVSVCMATFNGERFISQQIESILSQLGPDDELVISDDSSYDDTISIIKSFEDHRIKLYVDKQFRSASKNFEFALYQTLGEIIFLSDQDDVWLDGKLEMMLNELQNFDLVISDCQILNKDGTLFPDSFFSLYNSGEGVLKNFVKNTYLGNCMAFKRSILLKALPIPKKIHTMPNLDHGMWIGILANMYYKISFLPLILLHYRRHDSNVSPTEVSAKSPYSLWIILKSRFYLFIALAKRYIIAFFLNQ